MRARSPCRLGFGAEARLPAGPAFSRVFRSGRKTPGRNVILWHLDTASPSRARLGLAMSAKVGAAPRRNRLKRLARETFRLMRPQLKPGWDLVVYFRPACRWRALVQAREELRELLRRSGVLAS